jgi:hypothetical protein
MAWFKSLKLQGQLNKQTRVMGEKITIEHDNWSTLRAESERLRQENENLRIKIADQNRTPDRRATRDLEVIGRAAQKMMISAPGFAGAWEKAKIESLEELEQEERGKSLPRRLYEGIVRKRLPDSSATPQNTAATFSDASPVD